MIKENKATIKEKRYIRGLAEKGFNLTKKQKAKVASDSGYRAPYQAVARIEKSERIKTLVQQEMDRQGLTLQNIVGKAKELMKCEKPFRTGREGYIFVPDNDNQLGALKEVAKWQEMNPAQRLEIDKTERKYQFIEMHKRAAAAKGIPYIEAQREEEKGLIEPL